jgi:hypothetical protein
VKHALTSFRIKVASCQSRGQCHKPSGNVRSVTHQRLHSVPRHGPPAPNLWRHSWQWEVCIPGERTLSIGVLTFAWRFFPCVYRRRPQCQKAGPLDGPSPATRAPCRLALAAPPAHPAVRSYAAFSLHLRDSRRQFLNFRGDPFPLF